MHYEAEAQCETVAHCKTLMHCRMPAHRGKLAHFRTADVHPAALRSDYTEITLYCRQKDTAGHERRTRNDV